MGNRQRTQDRGAEKDLLESTGYDVSTETPQLWERKPWAVSLPALGEQGWAQVNLSTRVEPLPHTTHWAAEGEGLGQTPTSAPVPSQELGSSQTNRVCT